MLVLSEFTGVACIMKKGSLLFVPSDTENFSNVLHKALEWTMEKGKSTIKNYETLSLLILGNTHLWMS